MSGIHQAAGEALLARDVDDKLAKVHAMARRWRAGALALGGDAPITPATRVGRPGRPRLVHPRDLPRRGAGSAEGRARLMHAVAHIEFNAVNLALDAVHRFRGLPRAFYDDWLAVAEDEARHFAMVRGWLRARGHDYGDFPAHNGLWEMAEKTADDALARMALVPCVLEARGLDVTPGMAARLRKAGEAEAADMLDVICREEERHVAAGVRWFEHLCAERGLAAGETFRGLVRAHFPRGLHGPFNLEARRRAGFDIHLLGGPDC